MKLKVFVFLLAVSMIFTGLCNAELVGHWTFDEGSGNVAGDSSGNGNDGQFSGDGLSWVAGGLHFDGTSWLECGNDESLSFAGLTSFSVHALVKCENAAGKCIIWKGLGCSTWSQWMLGTGAHENGDNAEVAAFHFRTGNGDARLEARSTDPLPIDEMVFVTGTYDGGKLRIYLNGELKGEADASGIPWASPEQVYIGADPGCGNRCQWIGTMYDIKVFNNTLSQADISDLATAVSIKEKLIESWGLIKSMY